MNKYSTPVFLTFLHLFIFIGFSYGQWTNDVSKNLAVSLSAINKEQGFYNRSAICSDKAGGAIVCWFTNASPYEIHAARLNRKGMVQWTKKVCAQIGTTSRLNPVLISDEKGGAIIVWQDWRDTTTTYPPGSSQDIYGARLDSTGAFVWGAGNGIAVAKGGNLTGNKYFPVLCSDGASGAIVAWQAQVANGEIYAKRILADGTLLWGGDGGLLVSDATGNQSNPVISPNGSGGAVIAWVDERNGSTNKDIFAKALNENGNTLWGGAQGISVCGASGNQTQPVIISDVSGGVIIAWIDGRGSQAISAQKLNSTGVAQWTVDGVAASTLSGNEDLSLVTDGAGGAFLAWNTGANQSGTAAGSQNIIAQHVNSSGIISWSNLGIPVCNQSGTQWRANMISTSDGGAIIAWGDYRGSSGTSDIYAQKIDVSGTGKWTIAAGIQITSAICSQGAGRLSILNDGCDGAILSWIDRRNATTCGTLTHDIYAQYVQSDGTIGGISGCKSLLAALITSTNETCEGLKNGTATAEISGGQPPYSYKWNTTPEQTTKTATGLTPGSYTVTITDANSNVITKNVTISGGAVKPNSDFTFSKGGNTVSFKDNSSGALSYLWDFGDNTSSQNPNPSHTYSNNGTYKVCLTINNAANCSDSVCKNVDAALGMSNIQNDVFRIYPNPTKDILTVTSPGGDLSIESLELFDLLGRKISTLSIEQSGEVITIDLSLLERNTYFVKISSGSMILWRPVLKIN